MRAVGLGVLLLGVLFFTFPYYRELVPFIRLAGDDTRLLGGLFVALGGITLAVYRNG
jgi:hypothetical protein